MFASVPCLLSTGTDSLHLEQYGQGRGDNVTRRNCAGPPNASVLLFTVWIQAYIEKYHSTTRGAIAQGGQYMATNTGH